MGLVANHELAACTGLIFFYTLTYVLLICVAGFILGVLPLQGLKHANGVTVSMLLSTFRVRWVWLLLVINLAGLPPALFFGPKLGLLAVFFDSGVFMLGLALGLNVFLG